MAKIETVVGRFQVLGFQVPPTDADPGDDMVDFLQTCELLWDGDSYGVTIEIAGTNHEAHPGDWVFRVTNSETGAVAWNIQQDDVVEYFKTAFGIAS